MGYQVVSVTLKDGRRFDDLRVVGGVVTKVGHAGEVPFRDDEIQQMVCTHEAHALYAECQATALKPANSSCAKGLATLPGGQTFMGVAEYRAFLCDLDGWIIAGRLTPIGSPTPPIWDPLATDRWPDVIECEFEDEQGRRYRLLVDTYHGTAGDWRRIE